jgi:hypothetical protein
MIGFERPIRLRKHLPMGMLVAGHDPSRIVSRTHGNLISSFDFR